MTHEVTTNDPLVNTLTYRRLGDWPMRTQNTH